MNERYVQYKLCEDEGEKRGRFGSNRIRRKRVREMLEERIQRGVNHELKRDTQAKEAGKEAREITEKAILPLSLLVACLSEPAKVFSLCLGLLSLPHLPSVCPSVFLDVLLTERHELTDILTR